MKPSVTLMFDYKKGERGNLVQKEKKRRKDSKYLCG